MSSSVVCHEQFLCYNFRSNSQHLLQLEGTNYLRFSDNKCYVCCPFQLPKINLELTQTHYSSRQYSYFYSREVTLI